jgi:ABC-2 type transport system ATP-binding protein
MPVVTVDGLSKRFGAHLAVDNVSFEVGKCEVMGLLGPNGSGKTTILRLLTGYLRPTAGTARVAGFDVVRNGHAARGRIGYVPENAPLYPQMRANEFLAFMGGLRGLGGAHLQRRLAVARERLALDEVSDTIIGRLSRGYRQRVSLAQAILHQPDLLVLDEPTNSLDPRQIIEFRGLIRGLAEQCAVVVTSHILGEIERIADRVAILLGGRLLGVRKLEAPGTLRIRTRTDIAPRIAAVVRSAPEVTELIEEAPLEGTVAWRVRLQGSGAADRLVASLSATGIGVVEIAETGSDLEKTFLALTA